MAPRGREAASQPHLPVPRAAQPHGEAANSSRDLSASVSSSYAPGGRSAPIPSAGAQENKYFRRCWLAAHQRAVGLSVCPTGGRGQSASDSGRTSSRTINTIQLMSTGVSGTSPCEPVTCLLHSPVPASRPAGAKGSARAQGPSPAPRGSLTVLTCGAAGRGRARSPAGWPRWPWRTDLRGEGVSAARLGAGLTLPSTPRGPRGSHLLHRAGCTAPAAASTRGGGGGGVWRAGAEMVRSGAALRSSPHRQLLQCCCSSRCPLPPRSRHGPSPELSSRLSVGEKAAGTEGRGYSSTQGFPLPGLPRWHSVPISLTGCPRCSAEQGEGW